MNQDTGPLSEYKSYRAPDLEKVCVGKCIVSFCLGVLTLAVLLAAFEVFL